MDMKVAVLGIVLIVIAAISGIAFGLLTSMVNIPNTGVFAGTNVGVYTTSACTANLTSISWGTVRSGQAYTRTGYIRNNGNLNMTLALSTMNWNPAALSSVLSVIWNYPTAMKLAPGQIVAVIWTLTIPSGVTGYSTFSFDMLVAGTEA